MNTWIISDLHFGHKNIYKMRTEFSCSEEHDDHIISQWNTTVTKGGDRVYVLGDAAFTLEGLLKIRHLNGRKILVRGNHDLLHTAMYLAYFEEVQGFVRYKNAWLSHAPIHPAELRGRVNAHGHVHNATIDDPRYFNACPEAIGYAPVLFRDLVPEAADIPHVEEGD